MLWKFYRGDPDVCHYIFGTMHLATDEAYTYVNKAQECIKGVSIYAAEMNLNEASGDELISHFTLTDDLKFSGFFRPKQYEKYRKIILKAYKVDLLNYDDFTPFFMNNMLAELSLPKTKKDALDHYLWSFATESGKEMMGVESFEDQLRVLKNIPLDFQVKSFRSTIKNIKSFKSKLKKLNTLYAKGDIKQIFRMSKKSMGKIRKMMIYDRNEHMSARILEITANKPAFIALGAAHLVGKKGVLSLLKKEGFTFRMMR
ncbi:MAG: TraB/GumN family protein [Saprospiraceae bacterium]